MSKMEFTPAQQDAINAYGGSVIVSAAAGSGKTRVLVQRVISLLTDSEHPVDADRMLIVTFTKAAAEEMRARISKAIDDLIFEQPENTFLRRQQLLLANADICTIHSFCSRIIRENFFMLDINQDFRIASEGELDVLRHSVISDILEERHKASDSGFVLLWELLSASRSDKAMEQTLIDVHDRCSAHPFPDMWLDSVSEFYDPDTPVDRTVFAGVAYQGLSDMLKYMKFMLARAEEVIHSNQAFCTGTKTCGENKLDYLTAFLDRFEKTVGTGVWDDIAGCIRSFETVSYRKPTSKKNPATEEECIIVKNAFTAIDEGMKGELLKLFGTDSKTFAEDNTLLYPAVRVLCDIIKEFERRFFEEKKERGILDFSDLEHLMLRLLLRQDERGIVRTEFADILSSRYDQIMVDEYQDTNETQESIFRAISRNEENLFVVGDVKQSIYRFREAMPDIFKNRRKRSALYDREHPEFPAKIILDKNFRSRQGIIDSVNFVFRSAMSEKVGEIEYNDEEALTAGATYPPSDEPSTELHLMGTHFMTAENSQGEDDSVGMYEAEALYIAGLIKDAVRQKKTITDSGVQRPVSYGDFAVLMRFVSSHGQTYADVLNSCGIPAYIDKPYSLFGCYEVNVLISLLKTIDNPLQDIPVLSLLLSPVFGFTPDELAQLKTDYPGRFIYHRILACVMEEKDDTLTRKCRSFSELFRHLRTLSVTLPVSRLLNEFFDSTGFVPIMSATDTGELRVRNIRKFLSFVGDYESGGKSGVTSFVRHITRLEENGTDVSAGDTIPADSVRIMSVHHSKGLEFPVCILAGLDSKGSNDAEEIFCHTEYGFGMKTIDRDNMLKFNTLQRNVISLVRSRENLSEAMRVLYVAMTRAKEKLILLVSYQGRSANGLGKKLSDLAGKIIIDNGRISPFSVESCSSLADWIMLCALVHPSMQELRLDAGCPDLPVLPTPSRWSYKQVKSLPEDVKESRRETELSPPDEELRRLLERRFEEKYSHILRTVIPSKVSASALVHQELMDHHIARSRPSFMQEEGMTGAERGTAVHTFLQYADFSVIAEDGEGELERLVKENYLTKEQAKVIRPEDIRAFVESRTFGYIRNARKILREYRFTVNIRACDIDPSYGTEDPVILQGAIDCMIFTNDGIIILDYKTDRVKDISELAGRYARQLLLYRQAAQQLFDEPVKKCLIYSVYKSQETEIDIPS